MKLYYNSATEAAPIVIDGDPPSDQSAEVTALQVQVNTLQAQVSTLEAKIAAARAAAQAEKDADAATTAGQGVLDALA